MDDAFCDDSRTEFRAAMDAVLGPNTKLFVIIARKGFALRHGPLKLAEVDELVEWAKREHVDIMVTADCGPIVDRDRAASLFGDTREERAKLLSDRAAVAQDLNACMLTTSEVLQSFIECQTGTATRDKIDLARRLQITRGPVQAMAEQLAAAKAEALEAQWSTPVLRMLEERHAMMNRFGVSSFQDGLLVRRIASLDAELRAQGYTGELAPVHDETADSGELCAGRAAGDPRDALLAELDKILPASSDGRDVVSRARSMMGLLNSFIERSERMEDAIYWALGQRGDFEPPEDMREPNPPRYWWRRRLREWVFGQDQKPPSTELRLAAIEFWRDATDRALERGIGHEGSALLESAARLRHALYALGVTDDELKGIAHDRIDATRLADLILPGVYLDLPMQAYIDDPAISGSGLKKLLLSPADFKWELPKRNPLYTPPESDARALGTLVHAGVLEGMDVFHSRYFVAPEFDDDDPRLIRTADHAKNWLKDQGAKSSGLKAELFERCKEIASAMHEGGAAADELPVFIDDVLAELAAGGNGQREQIKPKAMQYVETVVRVVRAYPEADRLLRGGLPEVSIFWIEDGVRFKARLDYLRGWVDGVAHEPFAGYGPDPCNEPAVVDLKKFGNIPQRGRDLPEQLQQDAIFYCYDIQAVHNHRAALQIPLLLAGGKGGGDLVATGDGARERMKLLERIAAELKETAPVFHWLWVRTPGPPQVLCMDFPAENNKRFDHARWEIDQVALENLRRYRKQCGDELDADRPWITAGRVRWDDDLVREYQWDPQRV